MKKGLILVLISVMSSIAYAQNGVLKGKIIDGETGEGLIGATVSKEGTSIGAAADWDGNFSLALAPGTHSLVFQFISYQTQIVKDVEIKAGETTSFTITLNVAATELQEVVVKAEQIRDNDIALLTVQKKSVNLIDGISSQAFKKVGDNDLGAAMKRVTGVSVQGGKYVYVRGLGDRYTKTTLNGMSIPGLDPDKNAVQIDIFPTNTVENVVVYKTFTPDLVGDFTGGIVNIETKNFPEEKNTSISIGLGYNPDMHFQDHVVSYKGSDTDFLGFDNGDRNIPFSKSTSIPNVLASNGDQAEGLTRAFNSQLGTQSSTNFMNYGLSINHGNQINKEKIILGYNAIFNYKKNDEYYNDVEFGEYTKSFDKNVNNLLGEEVRRGSIGNQDVMWNALLSGAIKFDKHHFSANVMRTQNGVSSASQRNNVNLDDNPSTLQVDILTYMQRSITSGMFIGKHNFDKFKVEWKGALNWSRIYEPDYRSTRLEVKEGGVFGLNTGVGAGIDRFYRDLNENNQNVKVDVSFPFGKSNVFKTGGIATFKKRDFEVIEYFFRNIGDTPISGNANELLKDTSIWTPEKGVGLVAKGDGLNPSKTFIASQSVFGVYAMTEMKLTEKLNAIYGVRAEKVGMRYTGEDQRGTRLNNEQTLNEFDILPSANLVYALNDDMNLRGSFNRTLARPSFKEKSNAQIFDPISSRTFLGNLDLKETHINNFDFRWEYFFGKDEMVSVSGFYKTFDGHIELTSFDTAPDQITARNAGKSTVAGVEVEFRKNLTNNFSFGTNASFVKSAIDMNSVIVNSNGTTEYELRKDALREGETLSTTRVMSGQAPYLVNGYVNLSNSKKTINVNIAYNVQGETLNIVGSRNFPDVYTKSFHSLNMNIYKDLGEHLKTRVSIGVNNILAAVNETYFKSYQSNERIYASFSPGRMFTVKYSYRF
ncbi:MAG: TonB-dependent receptor [Cyclobacteriaceae bacterium]|nr:TonB-dependent receptor [Cyclobacteriaceae bacterium]